MSCACEIDVFDGHNDAYFDKIVTARKEHQCVECFGTISPGDQYERVALCSEDGWSHFNTCLPCKDIRECFCCTFYFGEVFESIQEESGDIRLSGLETLNKPARDMFFKQIILMEGEDK
jgi:hypothetical protein